MTAIPDINVLLYAVDSKSRFHKPCIDWLNEVLNGDEPLGFTSQSIAGFVRIGTNPKLIDRALIVAEAFGYPEAWLACRASHVFHPGASHLSTFRRLVEAVGATGNLTSDAHLAAIALEHDGEVISCDSDFGKFSGLKWFNPVTGVRVGS
jgi:uncharacterized protein